MRCVFNTAHIERDGTRVFRAVLLNELTKAVLSTPNCSYFAATFDEFVCHCFANTSSCADEENVLVGESHFICMKLEGDGFSWNLCFI